MAQQAATAIANRMAAQVNSSRRMEAKMNGGGSYTTVTPEEVFFAVYDGPITVYGSSTYCADAIGVQGCRAWASTTEMRINVVFDNLK